MLGKFFCPNGKHDVRLNAMRVDQDQTCRDPGSARDLSWMPAETRPWSQHQVRIGAWQTRVEPGSDLCLDLIK